MIHRHCEVPPDLPVEELPAVAIADILERGDLQDWQPLAGAIRRDPWGSLATAVARLLDAYPRYGTSPLWRAWIDRCRARTPKASRAAQEASDAQPVSLAALRRDLGLTQAQVARRLRMTQSDVSKLERREDARLSTLLGVRPCPRRPPARHVPRQREGAGDPTQAATGWDPLIPAPH